MRVLSLSIISRTSMPLTSTTRIPALDIVSSMYDNIIMEYEIETTNIFDKWLAGVGSIQHRARIINRFDHIRLGNFGDHKHLGGNLFELRFFFGPGYRAYYTIKDWKVVFLLCGGDKSTQAGDINKARAIWAELE
jgi:putative addiction module killer protein